MFPVLAQKKGFRQNCTVAGAAAIILLTACATLATSLGDYKNRVERARIITDELLQKIDETDTAFELGATKEIQQIVPAGGKIEWPGGIVTTDNQWLKTQLDAFAAESDKTKRGAILTGIGERLSAISETVGELERAAASELTKDQDKQKLGEILRREEYQKPQTKEESLVQKWIREFLEWLARAFPRAPIVPGADTGIGSIQFVLQILIYVIVIGVVGVLVYKFAPFLSQRFKRKTKKESGDRVILGERIGADESASDLFSEAETLARNGNLRAAIRKGYIALLCELSDRKLLRLARHKTNRDYLREVQKDKAIFENMTGLTRNFESNWYGLGTPEQADWDEFRMRYAHTIAKEKS